MTALLDRRDFRNKPQHRAALALVPDVTLIASGDADEVRIDRDLLSRGIHQRFDHITYDTARAEQFWRIRHGPLVNVVSASDAYHLALFRHAQTGIRFVAGMGGARTPFVSLGKRIFLISDKLGEAWASSSFDFAKEVRPVLTRIKVNLLLRGRI